MLFYLLFPRNFVQSAASRKRLEDAGSGSMFLGGTWGKVCRWLLLKTQNGRNSSFFKPFTTSRYKIKTLRPYVRLEVHRLKVMNPMSESFEASRQFEGWKQMSSFRIQNEYNGGHRVSLATS